MNILILNGSLRTNGNTDQITALIAQRLQAEAARRGEPLEIETLCLGRLDINPCRGCRICFDRGEERCPLKDETLAIKAKMQAADGVIIASPVYVDDVSGTVKTWIDRLAHVCHRPEFAGKCAFLITTVATSPTGHALRTLQIAFSTWGFHIVGKAGFRMGALMKRAETQTRFAAQAQQIAARFYAAVSQRQALNPSFFSLMMFKIQQLGWQQAAETEGDHIDFAYWRDNGWFAPGCEFFFPHRASRIKTMLARLTGAVIARFVL